MSLKKTRGIVRVLTVLFVLFLLLCEGTGSGWFLALAAAVGVVMLTLHLLFWTCPECGRHLAVKIVDIVSRNGVHQECTHHRHQRNDEQHHDKHQLHMQTSAHERTSNQYNSKINRQIRIPHPGGSE